MAKNSREDQRKKRHFRLRKKVEGTQDRPRLNIFRSLTNIYAQVIDDVKGHTLVSASTIDREVAAQLGELDRTGAAKLVGRVIAERAKAAGIDKVVFDRGGYKYHGRVKALADAAREAGLDF